MTAKLQSPEKELRFTRSSQATVFWLGSAVLTSIAITMLATSLYRDINESIPHPIWALLPLGLALLLARMAVKLTRHAYLILTPLGIEIFPFWRPAEGMRLVTWQEIELAEVNAQMTRLTLHHNVDKTAGIHLSLTPIRKDRRCLLAKAVIGRVSPDPSRNG